MAELIPALDPGVVRAGLERIRSEIVAAGREPAGVQVLAAVKYVPLDQLPALAQAGVRLVGENRAQELIAKTEAHPGLFTWDFIGHLQSRKVRQVLPRVRYVHSVCSDSVLAQLRHHGTAQTRVLIEVNISGEPGKDGVSPEQVDRFLARCPVPVVGLMTMPPQTGDPERSRPHFAALRALAQRLGLEHLSMGTSQDYRVALEEGATIVRIGTSLYRPGAA
jgi:pyridoxal phosphate enzyme (YggS family)